MNKTIKAKWVKALRSGKYRQAQDVLRSDSGAYCCLGVLRSVMHKGSSLKKGDEEYLHPDHKKEAGLSYKQQGQLATMNDEGKTFSQIADYIEKKL
jgi:hypothetical protein